MNEQQTFEHIVAESVSELGPLTASEGAIERTLSRVDQKRQRPRWLAFLKEPPMRTNNHVAVGSPTVRVAAIVIATMLLAVSLAAIGVAGQRLLAADGVIVVDQAGNGHFTTIAEAVAAAEDGDEVVVMPGTYTEAVTIDKDITLRGDGEGVILVAPEDGPTAPTHGESGSGEPYALLLDGVDGSVSGLAFTGANSLLIASGGTPVIEDNVFTEVGFAFGTAGTSFDGSSVVLNAGTTATVRGNTVTGGGPIAAFGGSDPTIAENTLDGGPHIWLSVSGPNAVVRDNRVSGTLVRGISVSSPGTQLIEGNHLSDLTGLAIRVGPNDGAVGFDPTIRDNTIEGASVGIEMTDGAAPVIEGNTLTANDTAIGASDGSGRITANSLTDNGVGLNLRGDASIVSENVIEGGRTGIVLTGGSTTLDGNRVSKASGRGIAIGSGAASTLTANTSCENGENLWVAENASPDIDDSNEICEDAVE